MSNIAVRKVKDLQPGAKKAVQHLLGRMLQDEEEVTVMVFSAHPAPSQAKKKAALGRLEKILDKAAENMKHLPDGEFDAAIDEAMEHVRPWNSK